MIAAVPFSPVPSLQSIPRVQVALSAPASATVIGVFAAPGGPAPAGLGFDRDRLEALGFTGRAGSTLFIPGATGVSFVAAGIGDRVSASAVRDAAAAFALAAAAHTMLALDLSELGGIPTDIAAEAAVEGVLLARYRYDALRAETPGKPIAELTLIAAPAQLELAKDGAERGGVLAAAAALARDLANTPHSHLSASKLADIAVALGAERHLGVEVFDELALKELGCGGLLGINAGSAEPPRMIKLTYLPAHGEPTGKLALVGKGVMYDSGGLGIKPNDRTHAQMKNDMSGAAAVLAAMSTLSALGCTTAVTGYLMCTDNMPSGTAIALGDVVTIRGGKTVEVMDTDAEGRVVMSDALVLAAEAGNDAIVDIATLTGSCLRALGPDVAGLLGNEQWIIDQVKDASEKSGEPVWQLPLYRPYRAHLDSLTADIANVSYGEGGAITASLFLSEFVGDVPWAHLDICGPAQVNSGGSWLPAGCSGFGARLLANLAMQFKPHAC